MVGTVATIKDSQAKAVEVGPTIGATLQRTSATVETFRGTIVDAGQAVVGNGVIPVLQHVAKFIDGS